MEPLLPERPPHPLGCHNPRVPDRAAMNAIFFVLRTGSQWQALRANGVCSSVCRQLEVDHVGASDREAEGKAAAIGQQ